ncbi:hypothetical protein [Lewinella cohaerens]|uniref:hypothetical protein n=1 Tax=Lewinella cohaerens TaxID=70995 RepID=UPI00037DE22C|nr:hypothetical protein [Lewinella cohaerens]
MKYVLFTLLLLTLGSSTNTLWGQNRLNAEDTKYVNAVEDTLGLLAYAFVNDSLEENRFLAVRAFIPTLVKALKKPGSFSYPFDQLNSVSIQYPADSTFRIFTWQLYVDKDTYRYFGAIQINSDELKLFPLVDRSFEMEEDLDAAALSPDRWYGTVYYNLHTVAYGDETYHLLFGYDGYEFFRKRKVVDVLRFVDGKPVFGAPVFVKQENDGSFSQKNRLLLEYSAAASVRCNYDPALDLLMFDHLTMIGGEYGEGPVQIPDGTYEAYRLNNGKWEYVEKVFDQILDEAPRPSPVLNGRKGKDLIGNGG